MSDSSMVKIASPVQAQRIEENLSRQARAVALLVELLREEFSLLLERRPQEVTTVELSLQDLMRQIAGERLALRKLVAEVRPDAQRVRDVIDILPEGDEGLRTRIEAHLQAMDDAEQTGALQAEKNRQLVLGLFDQSRRTLEYMHDQIRPKNENGYSKRGLMAKAGNQAPSLLEGRL